MTETIRLTMAQALARFLAAQMTEIEGERVPLFGGVAAIHRRANVALTTIRQPCLTALDQLGRRQYGARRITQFEIAFHRHLAQLFVGRGLVHAASLHQQALGLFDVLPVRQSQSGIGQFLLERLQLFETCDGHLNHRIDACRAQTAHHISRNPGVQGASGRLKIALRREQDNRKRAFTRHLLDHRQALRAGRCKIDQHNVRVRGHHLAQQIIGAGQLGDDFVASLHQGLFKQLEALVIAFYEHDTHGISDK